MWTKISRWIRFNLRYLGQPPWDTGISPPELIAYLETARPGVVLDVGCGTGTNLLTMASFGWSVVGVDLAWLSVLKARENLRKAGVEGIVRQGNVAGRIRLEKTFDLVLDIGCFHSLSPKERADYRQNLILWLKPGGSYLLYAHRKTSPDGQHGVSEDDFDQFSDFMQLISRKDSDEHRPDGGGGRPATWARFESHAIPDLD